MNQAVEAKNCAAPGFKALMVTQFLGALNDNVFRFIVSLMIIDALFGQGQGEETAYLVGSEAVFLLPFIFFSPYAGYLADRFSKGSIIRVTKGMEVLAMTFGAYFLLQQNILALVVLLLFMGLQSTLFSPAKYGILPEILETEHLSKGNGYIELWTFVAIIFGIVIGGLLKATSVNGYALPATFVIVIAMAGLISSFFVTQTRRSAAEVHCELNPFKEVSQTLRQIKANKALFLVLLAASYFWLVGSFFKLNTLLYAKNLMGAGDLEIAGLFAVLAVGIGLGSFTAGIVSEGKIELGLVPIGAIGISIFSAVLAFTYTSFFLTLVILFLLGLSSGFFIVPLNSFYQHNSPAEVRGKFIAAANFVSFTGMVVSCFLIWLFIEVLRLNESHLFLLVGVSTFMVAVYICRTLPEMLVRCVNWVLTHTVYRVRVVGAQNLPKHGGALIVCNHVSFVDASLLLGSIERPIRFLMYRPIYEMKFVHRIAKIMKAIPIDAGGSPKAVIRALSDARDAIVQGELVCIFAEGSMSRTGQMLPFSKGLEKIMKGVDAPIIPAYLDEVWGSIFSFKFGKFLWKIPKEIPYPVTVSLGKARPGNSKTFEIRLAIQELGSDTFQFRKEKFKLLHLGFLNTSKHHPFRSCMIDSSGKKLSYLGALASCLSLSQLFEGRKLKKGEHMVGVFLPPSIPAALGNISLLLSGRVPVNLNYTAGEEALTCAIRQCNIKTIITSRAFLEKLGAKKLPGMIFCEDLEEEITFGSKVKYLLAAAFLPLWAMRKMYVKECAFQYDSEFLAERGQLSGTCSAKDTGSLETLATVIFSSGSTGEPKGVMLSHGNITSNINSLYDVFQLGKSDCLMGVLPFFHSFGFTGTLWLPHL